MRTRSQPSPSGLKSPFVKDPISKRGKKAATKVSQAHTQEPDSSRASTEDALVAHGEGSATSQFENDSRSTSPPPQPRYETRSRSRSVSPSLLPSVAPSKRSSRTAPAAKNHGKLQSKPSEPKSRKTNPQLPPRGNPNKPESPFKRTFSDANESESDNPDESHPAKRVRNAGPSSGENDEITASPIENTEAEAGAYQSSQHTSFANITKPMTPIQEVPHLEDAFSAEEKLVEEAYPTLQSTSSHTPVPSFREPSEQPLSSNRSVSAASVERHTSPTSPKVSLYGFGLLKKPLHPFTLSMQPQQGQSSTPQAIQNGNASITPTPHTTAEASFITAAATPDTAPGFSYIPASVTPDTAPGFSSMAPTSTPASPCPIKPHPASLTQFNSNNAAMTVASQPVTSAIQKPQIYDSSSANPQLFNSYSKDRWDSIPKYNPKIRALADGPLAQDTMDVDDDRESLHSEDFEEEFGQYDPKTFKNAGKDLKHLVKVSRELNASKQALNDTKQRMQLLENSTLFPATVSKPALRLTDPSIIELARVLPEYYMQHPNAPRISAQQLVSILENQDLAKAASDPQGTGTLRPSIGYANRGTSPQNKSSSAVELSPATTSHEKTPNAKGTKSKASQSKTPTSSHGNRSNATAIEHKTPTSSRSNKSNATTVEHKSPETISSSTSGAFKTPSRSLTSSREVTSQLQVPHTPTTLPEPQETGIWNTITKVKDIVTSPFKFLGRGEQDDLQATSPTNMRSGMPEFTFRHSQEMTGPSTPLPPKNTKRKAHTERKLRTMPKPINKPETQSKGLFSNPIANLKLQLSGMASSSRIQEIQNQQDQEEHNEKSQEAQEEQNQQNQQSHEDEDRLANARHEQRQNYFARVEDEDDADEEANSYQTLAQAGQQTGAKRKRKDPERARTPPRLPPGVFRVPDESSSDDDGNDSDDSTMGFYDSPIQKGQSGTAAPVSPKAPSSHDPHGGMTYAERMTLALGRPIKDLLKVVEEPLANVFMPRPPVQELRNSKGCLNTTVEYLRRNMSKDEREYDELFCSISGDGWREHHGFVLIPGTDGEVPDKLTGGRFMKKLRGEFYLPGVDEDAMANRVLLNPQFSPSSLPVPGKYLSPPGDDAPNGPTMTFTVPYDTDSDTTSEGSASPFINSPLGDKSKEPVHPDTWQPEAEQHQQTPPPKPRPGNAQLPPAALASIKKHQPKTPSNLALYVKNMSPLQIALENARQKKLAASTLANSQDAPPVRNMFDRIEYGPDGKPVKASPVTEKENAGPVATQKIPGNFAHWDDEETYESKHIQLNQSVGIVSPAFSGVNSEVLGAISRGKNEQWFT
ncbi:hypothetical protein G7Y89_g7408 [Cudoniella acicularis]|uniref:Uncharacterized protein n=1 Tax=Cudoniella acicularis TaxID=354080 RepID=A0A8H4W202_9HELO|nr:hypothetical protein G7Y89_g7408 [Cudoniella acicularis]